MIDSIGLEGPIGGKWHIIVCLRPTSGKYESIAKDVVTIKGKANVDMGLF